MINAETNDEQALKFYLETFWIRNVGVDVFSIHDVNYRTNNACESFHNRFNRFLLKRKPNLWVFLKKLLEENSRNELKILRLNNGNYKTSKKSKFIHFENLLASNLKGLEKKEIGLEQFLKAMDIAQRR